MKRDKRAERAAKVMAGVCSVACCPDAADPGRLMCGRHREMFRAANARQRAKARVEAPVLAPAPPDIEDRIRVLQARAMAELPLFG